MMASLILHVVRRLQTSKSNLIITSLLLLYWCNLFGERRKIREGEGEVGVRSGQGDGGEEGSILGKGLSESQRRERSGDKQ